MRSRQARRRATAGRLWPRHHQAIPASVRCGICLRNRSDEVRIARIRARVGRETSRGRPMLHSRAVYDRGVAPGPRQPSAPWRCWSPRAWPARPGLATRRRACAHGLRRRRGQRPRGGDTERAHEGARPGGASRTAPDCRTAWRIRATAVDLQTIGPTMLEGDPAARRTPPRTGNAAALQLGYLIGAMRRGAAHAQGIHDETRRRLDQELQAWTRRARASARASGPGEATG